MRLVLVGVLASTLSGCIMYPRKWDVEQDGRDPYQGMNRGVFAFNDGLDRWVLRPMARGWGWVMPDAVQKAIDRFFRNLGFPRRMLVNFGQGYFRQSGIEIARFLTNTTVGLLGLFDPATGWGMPQSNEDFGQMFGKWGIPSGPFWEIPVVGPGSPRYLVGFAFDVVTDIRGILGIVFFSALPPGSFFGATLIDFVNIRSRFDPEIERARDASLDYYVFRRDVFIQRRDALVPHLNLVQDVDEASRPDYIYLQPDDDLYDDSVFGED